MEFAEKLPDRLLMDKIKARFGRPIVAGRRNVLDKHDRSDALAALKQQVLAAWPPAEDAEDPAAEVAALAKAFDAVEKEIVRRRHRRRQEAARRPRRRRDPARSTATSA